MLVCILLILGTWNGVLGKEELCRNNVKRECEVPDGPYPPETEEDFIQFCPTALQKVECLKNYTDKCGFDDEINERKFWEIRSDVRSFCGGYSLLQSEDICNISRYRVCPVPRNTHQFPRTEDDVDEQCVSTIRQVNCMKNYADKCGYEEDFGLLSEERFETTQQFLKEICQKDSRLHLNIVQNIGCLSEVMDLYPEECSKQLQNITEKLYKYARNKRILASSQRDIFLAVDCVHISLILSCFASEVSVRCGSGVKDVALEVVDRLGAMQYNCPAVAADQANDLIRVLELEMEEERFLNEIINRE